MMMMMMMIPNANGKTKLLEKLMPMATIRRQPSSYLQEMLSLAKQIGVGSEIVLHKFLQTLPPAISLVIASQKDLTM